MLEQFSDNAIRPKPLFYFRFEMRLEFIPFIEQEIKEFISFIEVEINKPEHVKQILVVLNKRIKDIDRFYDQNWSDYRAQQILRSRQQLVDFCKRNHAKIVISSQKIDEKLDESPPRQEKRASLKDKQIKSELPAKNKTIESPIMKKQAINFEKARQSSSKSISKEKHHKQLFSNQTSPYNISPIIQSPSVPIKQAVSRDKDRPSPIRGIKTKDSPVQKKVVPRKMTKQQYILHLRNKKTHQ